MKKLRIIYLILLVAFAANHAVAGEIVINPEESPKSTTTITDEPSKAPPAIVYHLRGYVRHNGVAMYKMTSVIPTLRVYDVDASQYIEDSLTFTYNNTNSYYNISGLEKKKYYISMTFLVSGNTSTLPGNYKATRTYDLPNMTPSGIINVYEADFGMKYIMRQRSPWDSINVDRRTDDPYRRHSGVILFDWDPIPNATGVTYSIRIDKMRSPDYPDPPGYGFISTVHELDSLIATYSYDELAVSSYGYYPTHYEVHYSAHNSSGEEVGYYQSTYINGSGVDYRFKVVPEYDGPIWYVRKNAAGYNNGSSWYHAFNSLQDAIEAAGADPDSDNEIWVAADTYYPDKGDSWIDNDREATFELADGVAIYGGFVGNETTRNQRNWINNPTILSGDLRQNDGPDFSNNSDNSYHVVTSNYNPGTTILDGFTITGGNANGTTFPQYWGGGIYARGSDLVISNCKVQANTAGSGGGMYAVYSSGSPRILLTTFIGNVSTSEGGAIAIQHSNPSFQSCLIMDNQGSSGGGVLCLNNTGGAPKFTNCLFSGNHATNNGGAIHQSGTGSDPTNPNPPIFTNCTIANNTAKNAPGGVSNYGGNDATLDSCILWGNDRNGVVDEAAQVSLSGTEAVIKYTCVEGWTGSLGGPGNIGDNPMFIDDDGFDDIFGTEDDNYRLLLNSPCINTGNPAAGYEDPDGSRNDMGAYGGPLADQTGGIGSLPGSGFLFTTVGNIPTSFITENESNPAELIGTANLTPLEASQYHIHQYINTPFGSTVRLHGLFGATDDVGYYEVLIAPWTGSTPPDGAFEPLTDTLYKTQYIYNTITGLWESTSVKIGPHPYSGKQFYIYTDEGFWSHLDLRLIWNTRRKPNGIYVLRCKSYSASYPHGETTPTNAKDLIIRIDNSPVDATIHNVKYDPANPNYNPIDDGEILECAIIGLESKTENLRFTITATHPNGHLRYWVLDNIAGKNDNRGVIAQQSYNPASGPYWFGVDPEEFQTVDAPDPPGNLKEWKRCAYQFRLRAWANVTNGYGYIFWDEFNDHYYIDFDVTGCNRADIDNNGVVNLLDFNIMVRHWLETCPAIE